MALKLLDTQQKAFEKVIELIFPNEKISANVRNVEFTNPRTGSALEIDVWLPDLRVCFEFQDLHHYATTDYYQSSLSQVQETDYIKAHVARKRDFTLIGIACWWDGLSESITETVRFHRPDLLPSSTEEKIFPIALNAPVNFFEPFKIPQVGELMLASFPPIPSQFSDVISVENSWWMGEKYDGIHSCWNADNSNLYTRTGNKLEVPIAIKKLMPNQFVNGEIWFGRGEYSKSIIWLRSTTIIPNWLHCRVVTFDEIKAEGQPVPFEERYARLVFGVPSIHPFVILALRVLCSSKSHLADFLKDVLADGGEGAIFRFPKSPFCPGRSPYLVKLKAVRSDHEALVIYKDEDVISLLTPDGTIVQVETANVEPGENPMKGDVVTYSNEKFTKIEGMPSSPRIHRVREDIEWPDVLRNEYQVRSGNLNQASGQAFSDSALAKVAETYIETTKRMKRRYFFEQFANSKNVDPLDPKTWYNISGVEFQRAKGAKFVLGTYKGSYMRAVIDLFPELQFDLRKFTKVPHKYWSNVDNRKNFFKTFAQEHGFDPLIPNNWYSSKIKKMLEKKGASSLFINYYGNYRKALTHLFPDIGLDMNKFPAISENFWQDKKNMREFFTQFARSHNFDPLIASNWYLYRRKAFNQYPKGPSVLAAWQGNYIKAIRACFPNIGLDTSKFTMPLIIPSKQAKRNERERAVFVEFAESRGFSLWQLEEWYKISMEDFQRFHLDARAVLKSYNGSLVSALMHLFPNFAWDKTKFKTTPRNHYNTLHNRRAVLEQYASERGFDPLVSKNWYSVTYGMIATIKGGKTVLSYYDHNVPKTLLTLFPDIGLNSIMFKQTSTQKMSM